MDLVTQSAAQYSVAVDKMTEEVLVVPRSALPSYFLGHGFSQHAVRERFAELEKIVRMHGQFNLRGPMEIDENYKQIIPYMVFTHEDELFLMQRPHVTSESRLSGRYSLGIGGHITREDVEGRSVTQWGMREFYEEVSYSGSLELTPIGIMNDDTDAVGRVHIGMIYLVHGNSSKISVKSEFKHGYLAPLEECSLYYDRMESWSQYIFEELRKARYL